MDIYPNFSSDTTLLKQVIYAFPDLIHIHDMQQNRTVYANRKLTAVLGYTDEEALAMNKREIETLIHPEDAPIHYDKLERLLKAVDGEIIETVYRLRHANGDYRWFLNRHTVFRRQEDQRPHLVMGLLQDITENRLVDHDISDDGLLKARLHKEQEISHLKTAIMQRISHEFRTPLTIILASTELIEHYSDRLTEAKRAEQFARIHQQINHLTVLIADISQVMSQSLSISEFSPTPIYLDDALQDILNQKYRFFLEHGIRIIIGIQQTVLLDVELFQRIVENILINAVKFSPSGSDIIVQIKREDDWLVMSFKDAGIGIPPQDLLFIYEPFFRGSNINEIGGLGLGLTIVKDAVEAHHGQIEVISDVDKGTEVIVKLPYLSAETNKGTE